ncbi:GTP-binding protein, HSR1-related [Caballeronia arvi]|uniref:GTP-binding protein, HSR1-related n=1 Tax=Caballeronia arvi TaxID=1777135 RepID=A0A158L2H8_9BURK|nr:dynamin family protein [Caballeronia arvi]SAL87445.1 GTP-binding protein, HSR1-related [Caballeronia arvi]
MTADTSNEQRFVADVEAFEFITLDVTTIVRSMEEWLARLSTHLRSSRLTWRGLNEQSEVAWKADAINISVEQSMARWTEQWRSYEPAHAFADSYDDKVLLLVFGKFNAGKSSFCNLLADRFAAHGKHVQYFYLEGGQIVETPERFKEGVTETTARLQGVRLAEKLVLVDTPGLHSVTSENAALTQRFADSADGVLWLTSSTSPGQVQELDELGRELHRNKPLLPVVTRSDVYEEDEVEGEICKVLRNKTQENRTEQEADVNTRAAEKLSQMGVARELLKAPISVSTYLACKQGQTRAAMNEAGFERLFAALHAITAPTLAYKRRKQAEVLLHHLEENVIGALSSQVVSSLQHLRSSIDFARDKLEQKQELLANALWRAVVPELPKLLDEYSNTRDLVKLGTSLSNSTRASLLKEIDTLLREYELELGVLDTKFDTRGLFEDVVTENREVTSLGHEEVLVDYQLLYETLAKAIRALVIRVADDAIGQCRSALVDVANLTQSLEASLHTHDEELLIMKRVLRAEFR